MAKENMITSTMLANGGSPEQMVGQLIFEIGSNPQKQQDLIGSLFGLMAKEGNHVITYQRALAFHLFSQPEIQQLFQDHSKFTWKQYLKSVRKQNDGQNLRAGAIPTLLEAGKILATVASPTKSKAKKVLAAWEQVAQKMFLPHETEAVQQSAQEIAAIFEATKFKVRKKTRQDTVPTKETDQVEVLSKQGLNIAQIAAQLEISESKVRYRRAKLFAAGRLEKIPAGYRGDRQEVTTFDQQVLVFSSQGLFREELAEQLNSTLSRIDSARKRLLKQGLAEKLTTRRHGPSTETARLMKKVTALIGTGLSIKEMTKKLKTSENKIKYVRSLLTKERNN
jgi:DNA-binding NarL/FixJ family response regulator